MVNPSSNSSTKCRAGQVLRLFTTKRHKVGEMVEILVIVKHSSSNSLAIIRLYP